MLKLDLEGARQPLRVVVYAKVVKVVLVMYVCCVPGLGRKEVVAK